LARAPWKLRLGKLDPTPCRQGRIGNRGASFTPTAPRGGPGKISVDQSAPYPPSLVPHGVGGAPSTTKATPELGAKQVWTDPRCSLYVLSCPKTPHSGLLTPPTSFTPSATLCDGTPEVNLTGSEVNSRPTSPRRCLWNTSPEQDSSLCRNLPSATGRSWRIVRRSRAVSRRAEETCVGPVWEVGGPLPLSR